MPHLTQDERYQIDAEIQTGKTQKEIALRLGKSASAISRELSRNKCSRGSYDARVAHKLARDRRHKASSVQRWTSNCCE